MPIDTSQPWEKQIPADIDITHFQFNPQTLPETPYLVTEHGNARKAKRWPLNTVFVSKNHASRYGSDQYVLNGLDWDNYGAVDLDNTRTRFHFLGKAEWSVKNVSGAIRVAKKAGVELDVLGGNRINFRRGFRWTLSRSIHFHGMVGGSEKTGLLNASRGMIFPVRWHEPFGLAVIESLYFGCPVFATPYGALPELVPAENAACYQRMRWSWHTLLKLPISTAAPATSTLCNASMPTSWRVIICRYTSVFWTVKPCTSTSPLSRAMPAICLGVIKAMQA